MRRYVVLGEDGGVVTPSGARFLTGFGAELHSKSAGRRIFRRACLDWSERRYHIADHVGAEIWRRTLELGWVTQRHGERAVQITAAGRAGFRDALGVTMDFGAAPTRYENPPVISLTGLSSQ